MAKKKKSLKQRMKEKKEELNKKGGNFNILRQKDEGTIRVRVLPTGEDNEFVAEVLQFWLGKGIDSVISPETFGEPCALLEKYHELKDSDDEADKDLAKKLMPKRKYLMPVLVYADLKGKKVNDEDSGKLLQITNGLYQEIIDFYLDEDEWGDMTDPKNGYDLKITRTGKGQFDTTYTVAPCKNTAMPKEWRKEVDLDDMVRKETAGYEETVTALDKFMGSALEDEDDDEPETGKKKSRKSTKTKTKSKLKAKRKKRKKDL